jgi:pimeloyl-ACP methyl ester carboxylesterase
MSTRRIKVSGGELYADIEGDGPPIVLLHSGITDARQWEAVTQLVGRRATVIRYDRRGYGRSAKYKRGRYCHSLDLLELLDGLGLDRVVACGNSAGAAALIDAAALQPERFARLVLLAPPAEPWEWSEQMEAYGEAEEAALAAGDLDTAVQLSVDQWVHRLEDREPVATMLRTALENQRRRPYEEFWLDDPQFDRVTCPVRLLVGEHDHAEFRAIAWHLADQLADATAEEVPGAGHLLGLEAAELVASTL